MADIPSVEISPEELELEVDAKTEHQYLELYAPFMEEYMEVDLVEKESNESVWNFKVRRAELKLPASHSEPVPFHMGCNSQRQSLYSIHIQPSSCSPSRIMRIKRRGILKADVNPPPDQHFIERHRAELIQRASSVEQILDDLVGVVIGREQYEKISSNEPSQEKMRQLYRLLPSWNDYCKDLLYRTLKKTNKFLIAELEEKDNLRN
uniref:CARD domain-containing protein n=1 Tax=Salvator merianae TaxID=96440 RepID=A0A8D0DMJ9_SALMN